MLTFVSAVRATRGAREYQEDSALLWPGDDPFAPAPTGPFATGERLLAILADGMGGHAGGALASRMACDHFLSSYAAQNGSIVSDLLDALAAANDAIAGKVEEEPLLSGMGSTLVGAVFGGNELSCTDPTDLARLTALTVL